MAKRSKDERRVYDLGVTEDLEALAAQRRSMLARTHLTVGQAFDELRFEYRIGRVHLCRVIGPGVITPFASQKHRAEFRHDVALGIVKLRDAVAAGRAGTWKLRRDGTRSRVKIDHIPDAAFHVVTDWRAIINYVVQEGWTYRSFARLAGCETSQISRLSWGTMLPRLPFGECVLWAVRHVRDRSVVTPQFDSRRSRRARARFSKSESEPPWWLPAPLSREDAAGDPAGRRIAAGEQPNRPARKAYSGKLVLRVSPEVHAAVAAAAEMRGESIDEWASEVLGGAASRSLDTGVGR